MQQLNLEKIVNSAEIKSKSIEIVVRDSELEAIANTAGDIFQAWANTFDKQLILRGFLMASKKVFQPLELNLPTAKDCVAKSALLHLDYNPVNWSKGWLEVLHKLENSESPAGLVELSSGKQIWVNKACADLLQLTPKEILSLRSYDHWLPGEIDKLWAEVRSGKQDFDLSFQTIHCLSGDKLQMKTYNEILELDGSYYRYSTVREAKVLAKAEVLS